jgi:arylsulfatase
MTRRLLMAGLLALTLASGNAHAQAAGARKPNILVIMTDDVGVWNISAYHRGMMGGEDAEHRSHRQ